MCNQIKQITSRIVPFIIYISFIAILELLTFFNIPISPEVKNYLYPVKIILVISSIIVFRKSYTELKWKELLKITNTMLSLSVGIIVIIFWINLDMSPFVIGKITPFNPSVHPAVISSSMMLLIRAVGAVLVVPIIEELFWRSFLCRYLINHNFTTVTHGKFTLFSFLVTSVLFGLEHNLWFAGIIAGVAYNFIYLKTKSVTQCIFTHAISNFTLAAYVIYGGHWKFW